MLRRTLLAALFVLATAAQSQALNLTVQLFPITGEVRFRNTSGAAVPFAYYSIVSPSGALNGNSGIWKSITENYDASGNDFIDPLEDWTKLSAVSTQLTEGVFSGPGGSLPAFRSLSLGQIWNPALYPSPDLTFDIREPNSTPITTTTQFAVAGDYNEGGGVGPLDYDLWRQTFGSTTNLAADGNLNGIVDTADYVIWRNNLGIALPPGAGSGSGSGLRVGGIVPEPATAVLLLTAGFATLSARGPRRRSERRAARQSLARL
jgi:hypothetical protein